MSETYEIAEFYVTVEGDCAVCRFGEQEDFGDGTPQDAEGCFRAELADGRPLQGKRIVLDLSNKVGLSSRQVGALLAVHRATESQDKMKIEGVRPNVRSLFDLTKLDRFFAY